MESTYTNLVYHLIFNTEGRAPTIEAGVPLLIGGMPDHVHILSRQMPDISISDMVLSPGR